MVLGNPKQSKVVTPILGHFCRAFCDAHVAALKIEQTVGAGTLANPKGRWTITPGD
jgi:hypothetical protein